MSAFTGVRQLLLFIFHKILSATCGKNVQVLDTETDMRIIRISVAALQTISKMSSLHVHHKINQTFLFLLTYVKKRGKAWVLGYSITLPAIVTGQCSKMYSLKLQNSDVHNVVFYNSRSGQEC